MKINTISITESEPNTSSESDFKDVLNSVKSEKRKVKSVKKISETNKYERKKKRSKILNSLAIAPILDLSFNNDNKRKRDEARVGRLNTHTLKISSIEELSGLSLPNDILQKMNTSISFNFCLYKNDGATRISNEKSEKNNSGLTSFFIQQANYEKIALNPTYINTKTSRDYQVYFKGRRYYFNIDKNGVLRKIEDEDDGA